MRLLLRRATRAMGQQPVWIMIALVLDAAIAVTGILVGPGFNVTGLLAVGPLLACARCNGRMTALVAGYAVALCAVVAAFTGTIRTATEGYRIGMVAVAGALAVLAAVIRSRREGALIEINERVQHRSCARCRPNSAAWHLPHTISRPPRRPWSAATFMTSR